MDGQRWVTSCHPTQGRRKPYLTNNKDLGREFRKQYVRGLRRLIRSGKLRTEGKWAFLRDPVKRDAWLDEFETAWNVFIEGPPHGHSQPEHVVKYLARYISGGPIADRRIISQEDDEVTFWARTRDKKWDQATSQRKRYRMSKSEPFTLEGREFVRRWSMHILPKGYTRSRSYGGYHGSKRKEYLARCQQLLGESSQAQKDTDESHPNKEPESSSPKCPRCDLPMTCIVSADRPSWREIFEVTIYREPIYSPLWHLWLAKKPAAHSIEGYG